MRIGMVFSTPMPPREGVGYYVMNLSRYLHALGHQLVLITRGTFQPNYKHVMNGIPVWNVTYIPIFPFHVHFHQIFLQQLLNKIESELDVLHLHSPLVGLQKTSLPIITTVHSPILMGARSIRPVNLYGLAVRLQTPFSFYIEKRLFRKSHLLVATSRSVAENLIPYGVDPVNINILGNGVDANFFTPAEPVNHEVNPIFLTVGRLEHGKGLEDLLDCARFVIRYHPRTRFLIAGEGRLHAVLEKRVKEESLSGNVIFLGQIGIREDLVNLFKRAYAIIHPSHYEGLPTVLLEAMACAKATIAYDVSGSRDLVQDGETGYLVPDRRPDLLAGKVLDLLQDPQKTSSFGAAARKKIEMNYTWEIITQRYVDLYEQLLELRK
jgi:glycosyltransferase involved in cell wall biosynthesis